MALGWTANISSNKPVIEGTSRPSVPRGLSEMLLDDSEVRIDRVQWSYLSSVSHVTSYGIREATTRATPSAVPGPAVASYGQTSLSVRVQAVGVLRRCGRLPMRGSS